MSNQTLYVMSPVTDSADPWTENGYSDWQHSALAIRREWMGMMGLSQEEIDENCELDPPTDMDEEFRQYNAMFAVQDMNARH